ncbi:hypothetical protein [Caldalkalibacillus mannanilyticus]|uniref:hypothetical protein n=1 Tax=Caldalkalibacillus mannanilyticus TaxID=1418 RepID=UPI000468FE00|nr:hypothetical protein [Caldalkalibacillus mannanilyticus]
MGRRGCRCEDLLPLEFDRDRPLDIYIQGGSGGGTFISNARFVRIADGNVLIVRTPFVPQNETHAICCDKIGQITQRTVADEFP